MTTPTKYYTISRMDNGLVYSYQNNQFRKSDCKHIHVILDIIEQKKKDMPIINLNSWNG